MLTRKAKQEAAASNEVSLCPPYGGHNVCEGAQTHIGLPRISTIVSGARSFRTTLKLG